jgi:hypothetical protein
MQGRQKQLRVRLVLVKLAWTTKPWDFPLHYEAARKNDAKIRDLRWDANFLSV